MDQSDILVIGGNAAGLSAASAARRQNPRLTISVMEQGDWISYKTCSLPYYLSREIPNLESLLVHSKSFFATERNIEVRSCHRVMEIYPARHRILVEDRKKQITQLHVFGKLIIATGACCSIPKNLMPPVPGVFAVRNPLDIQNIISHLAQMRSTSCAVLGGGYTGIEMAESLCRIGKKVVIIERSDRILNQFDPEFSRLGEERLIKEGIAIVHGRTVQAAETAGGALARVILCDGSKLDVSMLVVCGGFSPDTRLAAGCGIELDATRAIRVDSKMQTSIAGIYAAGDCCSHFHLSCRRTLYRPSGVIANHQGRIAGVNAAGGRADWNGTFGSSGIRIFDRGFGMTGISAADCRDCGIQTITSEICVPSTGLSKSDDEHLRFKLIVRKPEGTILGAQIAGPVPCIPMIDSITTAMHAGLHVRHLAEIGYMYSPPLASYPNAASLAARQIIRVLDA